MSGVEVTGDTHWNLQVVLARGRLLYFSQTLWSSPDLHHFGKLVVLNTIHELAVCFRCMSENFQDLKLLKASSNMRLLVILKN